MNERQRSKPARVPCAHRGFVKVATCVDPTPDLDDRAGGIERVVSRVGVGLKIPAETVDKSSRPATLSGRRVVVDDVGMTAVAEMRPEPGFVCSALVIEHRDRRVVGLNDARSQQIAPHPLDERTDQLGRLRHPAAERRARQRHAVATVDLCLAVERLMVAVLADRDLRQQTRAWESLLDRLRRLRGARDRLLAALASEHPAHVLDDLERGWRVVELLRDFLADLRELRAARRATTLVLGQRVLHPFAWEILRERLTSGSAAPPVLGHYELALELLELVWRDPQVSHRFEHQLELSWI